MSYARSFNPITQSFFGKKLSNYPGYKEHSLWLKKYATELIGLTKYICGENRVNLFFALVIPILILGLIYILIIENKGMPLWIERISDDSDVISTFGVITIAVLSIWKYLSGR